MKKHLSYSDAALRSIDAEARTAEFIISDASIDRHGTVLDVAGWELSNFNNNGIVGYNHDVYGDGDNDPDKIIGKGSAYVDGEKLIGKVEFEPAEINPLAEKIFNKVAFGTLKATSVGFLPQGEGEFKEITTTDGTGKSVYHYGKRELLEFSIVNIPSNPNAIRKQLEDQLKELQPEAPEQNPEICEEKEAHLDLELKRKKLSLYR